MKRLREFDTVTINVPFEARGARTIDVFDARALAIVGPTAALEPVNMAEILRLPERVPGALLSFRKDHALVGLKGTLVFRRGPGDLRFTVGDGVQLNRRSATRVKLPLSLRLHRLGTTHRQRGLSVDVSADGILAETDLPAAVGDLIGVEIELGPDVPLIEATARVVRQASGLLAMQFSRGENGVRSRLARIVVEHNRDLLRQREEELMLVEF